MGTAKSRKTRRNTSRPEAYCFLSNINLGTEPVKDPNTTHADYVGPSLECEHGADVEPDLNGPTDIGATASLHSSDSSLSATHNDDPNLSATDPSNRVAPPSTAPILTSASALATGLPAPWTDLKKHRRRASLDEEDVQHHKLTREDSERPIASEKIKKKTAHADKDPDHPNGILSLFRYYTGKLRPATAKRNKADTVNLGYVQQQLANTDSHRRRTALSYAHFLTPSGSLLDDATVQANLDQVTAYDPFFLDNDSYSNFGKLSSSLNTLTGPTMRPSDVKREMNDQFRQAHPELAPEITLSKIRSIKDHLLEIGKAVDLEVSSVAHAYVYFEKLVIKNVVTKKNRKLIAACCLFLAFKVNEAKGTWCEPLLEAMDDELNVDSEEIHEHEFAVFADLEFDLYIPRREFMPHFEQIFSHIENKTIEEYLDDTHFYEVA